VVVVSHGGGGSRDALSFLANHLASHGYVVVVAQHAGSDLAALRKQGRGPRALRQALEAMVDDERNWSDRPKDISFLIDRVLAGGLGPRVSIDRDRIAVAGHSYGAYTALAVGGLLVDLKDSPDTSFRDPRVRAIIALSPHGTGQYGINNGAWARVDIPVMMMTGTKDSGLKGGEDWIWRRQAFDAMKPRADAGPYYLAIIEGAGHMAFADESNALLDGIMGGRDPQFHGWIRQISLAFLDGHVRDENSAQAWLHARGIQAESNRRVTLELGGKASEPAAPAEPQGRGAGGGRGSGPHPRGLRSPRHQQGRFADRRRVQRRRRDLGPASLCGDRRQQGWQGLLRGSRRCVPHATQGKRGRLSGGLHLAARHRRHDHGSGLVPRARIVRLAPGGISDGRSDGRNR
jgi:predicted dienelactone hydrolase